MSIVKDYLGRFMSLDYRVRFYLIPSLIGFSFGIFLNIKVFYDGSHVGITDALQSCLGSIIMGFVFGAFLKGIFASPDKKWGSVLWPVAILFVSGVVLPFIEHKPVLWWAPIILSLFGFFTGGVVRCFSDD